MGERRMLSFRAGATLALLSLAGPAPLSGAQELVGRACVVDGDTIDIGGRRFHLAGIDAPEPDQSCGRGGKSYPCGREATTALASLIQGKEVRCDKLGEVRPGEGYGHCFVGEISLNQRLVARGWALADRDFSKEFVCDEEAARALKAGLWEGAFTPPWKHRQAKAQAKAQTREPKQPATAPAPLNRPPQRPASTPPATPSPKEPRPVITQGGNRLPEFDIKAYCHALSITDGLKSYIIEKDCRNNEEDARRQISRMTVPPEIHAFCHDLADDRNGGSYWIMLGCIDNELKAKSQL